MAEITVKAFAEQIGVSTDRLIAQFAEAGVEGISKPSDQLSSEQKMKLLTYLRKAHGGESQAEPRRVTLKRRSVSELKVAGSQGRAKTVNVEVRRKRTYVKRAAVMEQEKERVEQEQARRAADEAERAAAAAEKEREQELEKKQREQAAAARKREEERKEREEREQREMLIRQQEEERRRAEAEAKREEEEEQRRQERALSGKGAKVGGHGKANKSASEKLHVKAGGRARRTVRDRGTRHGRVADVESQHAFEKPVEPKKIEVEVPDAITAGELAQRMAVKSSELIRTLMKLGVMATINQTLDQDTAVLAVEEMGHTAKLQAPQDAESALLEKLSEPEGEETPRYPVVTVMGHVDHGKTSLLDYVRSTRVTAKEAGGITQHIGAYHVPLKEGGVTFLDTPGHAAFTSMRARGTQVTDIVILVVAADDGVMPQTVEAIEHARSGGVPIVVAVNKIDKPEADQERVKNELSQRNVIPEEWGGDTQFVPISAKTGEGVDALLEAVHLQAELLELKARSTGAARGVVLEASLDKGRGAVATVLVEQGTLHRGDILLAGSEFGRVRALLDENGRQVNAAGPSIPVQVLGLSSTPTAGEEAVVVPDEKTAREVASFRQQRERGVRLAAQQPTRLNEMFSKLDQSGDQEMRLVIKADVHGSLEAIRDAVSKFSSDEVSVKVVSSGVGAITESDVNLALASDAAIIGFNVRADSVARRTQQEGGVDIRYYSVIYELIDDVRKALSGMLSPELKEEIIGNAEVKDVFQSPKFGAVAGCLVTEGVVRKDSPIRVLRDSVVIFEGQLESLRRFKDNVAEVRAGTECGIAVKDYKDVRAGDQIEVFQRIEVEREIEV